MNKAMAQRVPLIIGLAIPILMVLLVAGAVYLPGLFTQPAYGFLYASSKTEFYTKQDDGSFIQHQYVVEDKRLVDKTLVVPAFNDTRDAYRERSENPVLYRYDVATDMVHEVSLDEAQQLLLDRSQQSPDGFRLTRGRSDGLLDFFGSRGNRDWFLMGHNTSHRLELKDFSDGYYSSSTGFLGWIVE